MDEFYFGNHLYPQMLIFSKNKTKEKHWASLNLSSETPMNKASQKKITPSAII
jgi:hypothetical protein